MRKYFGIFKLSWQNSLEYRFEFFAHMALGLVQFVVLFFIWKAIFKQTSNFSGYTFVSMISYLVMVQFLHFINRQNTARQIAEEIKNGDISIFLLKPMSYLKYWFFSFLASRFFEFLVRLLIIFVFLAVYFPVFQTLTLERISIFVLFLGISLFFNFLLNCFFASLAFWITDVRMFSSVIGLSVGFFSGELMPLDILPGVFKTISQLLPFQYMLFFPIKIFLGGLSTRQIFSGMTIAIFWTIGLFFFLRYFWAKGLKKYEAIGQ